MSWSSWLQLLAVQRANPPNVVRRQTGDVRDVGAGAQLRPIPVEEAGHVAAIPEEEHDVRVRGGVLEAERVPEFVQAGQIDDGLADEGVGLGARGDVLAEGVRVR